MLDALTPLYLIALNTLVLLLIISLKRNLKFIFSYNLVIYILCFVLLFGIKCNCLPAWAQGMVVIDEFYQRLIGVVFLLSIFSIIAGYFYLKKLDDNKEEYFILLNTSILGVILTIISSNFVVFLLGLELMSIPIYVMIAYNRKNPQSVEAAIKYLILAGASTAILIFGMALVYSVLGTMEFSTIPQRVKEIQSFPIILNVGIIMIITGIAFKLALAPFHIWSPDIYQGASVNVTMYIGSIAKVGVIIFLLRFANTFQLYNHQFWYYAITLLSILSMFVGNLLAVNETKIKRIIAFSSIAHMGYILIPFLVESNYASEAVLFYVVMYIISVALALGAISSMSMVIQMDKVTDLKGFLFKNPLLAISYSIGIISLAGMPLTAGFMAKIFVLLSGVEKSLWLLVILLIINSGIGLYYYIKMIMPIFSKEESEDKIKIPVLMSISLIIIAIFVIILGIVPSLIL